MYCLVLGSNIVTWRLVRSTGKTLAEGWSEPFLQNAGLLAPRTRRGEPYPSLSIEHAVMVIGLGVPDLLIAPVRRRLHECIARRVARPERFWRVGIPYRRDYVRRGMLFLDRGSE